MRRSFTGFAGKLPSSFILQPTVQNIIPYRAQAFKFCVHSVTYLLINVYMPSGCQVVDVRNGTKCLSHFRTTLKTKALTISSLSVIFMLRCLGLTAPLLLLRVSITSLSKPCYNKTTLKIVFEFLTLNQKSFHSSEAMQPHGLIEFTFLPLYNTN